jgi:hypothetical protein
MLKLCPMAVAILVFQSTNQAQTLYRVMEGTFQQCDISITYVVSE